MGKKESPTSSGQGKKNDYIQYKDTIKKSIIIIYCIWLLANCIIKVKLITR